MEVIDATPDVAHNEPATTKLLGGITGKGFMPGQSGNPTGRKKKPLTEALEQVFTPAECLAAAKALAQRARKGSIAHFQEAANRLEGRVSDTDESRGNITFNVVISAPRPTKQLND